MFSRGLPSIIDFNFAINFFIYALYGKYKDKLRIIFSYLSDASIYEICLLYFEEGNRELGLEVLDLSEIKKIMSTI